MDKVWVGLDRHYSMKRQPKKYEAKIPKLEGIQIILNINELEQGSYELILLNRGLAIKKIRFDKK
ncbi:hypothetical protein [Algoriphagus sp. AGSA1]|uniref:hypothetical protein n=1 Tax=Algoriphagus sp. AGSA1 TaxID=2907213 RepID=UPI001F22B2ED|nr:hypothetical protein [Algoriphagus sp. AGSA1]